MPPPALPCDAIRDDAFTRIRSANDSAILSEPAISDSGTSLVDQIDARGQSDDQPDKRLARTSTLAARRVVGQLLVVVGALIVRPLRSSKLMVADGKGHLQNGAGSMPPRTDHGMV
jgi:hypothetical protein